jgi:gas vesicle protein
MSEHDTDFGTFLAGFLIGGLIGAAVALLYAPQSGEETRTIIKEKSIELKDKAAETAEEARARAEKALEEAKARAELAIQETRVRADELARITKEKAAEFQQKGQVVIEDQKSRLEGAIEAGKKVAKRSRPAPESDEAPDIEPSET